MTLRTFAPKYLMAMLIVTLAGALAGAQTRQTQRVMREKLAESSQLLAAVVTSNWSALDKHARALQALTDDPGWDVMRLPEFAKQTVAFQKANMTLIDAAGTRDQRMAVTAYNGVVAACVECHRYVARARVVQAR